MQTLLRNLEDLKDGTTIFAVGPESKQPSTRPYRIVMRGMANGSYAVHTQFTDKGDFHQGDYFPAGPEGLVAATKQFAKRVSDNAGYLATLWR